MTLNAAPNSPEALAPLISDGRIPRRRVWGMLAVRSGLSFALLLILAAAFGLMERSDPIKASAAWWLWSVTVVDIVCIGLLVRFGRAEGLRLRDLYFIDRSTWRGDLVWASIALMGIAVSAMTPATWLADLLWGGSAYPNTLLLQPLPPIAIYPLILLVPTAQALAELPLYWGYVAPRLRAGGMGRWLAIATVGAALSLQHLFFSFQLDWRYDLWLAVKFLPFALWTGFIVDRRPTALPYLMAMHFALDASLPVLVLMVTRGMRLS